MVVDLDEQEIKHIEIALKDHYKDEWCAVCNNIAKKLGFAEAEEACDHNWVSAVNEVIKSGEICTKCHAIRA